MITGKWADVGKFKGPVLRALASRAPYFHNGSATTLNQVVVHYARGGDDRSNLSPLMKPLKLNQREKADLVAFMKALTGQRIEMALPHLPQ